MSENIEETLYNIIATTEFSLQLDESTLPENKSLLLAYVCFIKDEKLVQDLLFARKLKTDSKGESVFKFVVNFFNEKNIPLLIFLVLLQMGTIDDRLSLWLHQFLEKSCTWCAYSTRYNSQISSVTKNLRWSTAQINQYCYQSCK